MHERYVHILPGAGQCQIVRFCMRLCQFYRPYGAPGANAHAWKLEETRQEALTPSGERRIFDLIGIISDSVM